MPGLELMSLVFLQVSKVFGVSLSSVSVVMSELGIDMILLWDE